MPRQTQTAVLALIALITSACAAKMFVPPAGPGVPAPDAAAAWTAATERCRTVTTFAPTLRLSGRVAGSRVPGLTVLAAVTATGGIRLQATAGSGTIFELAGTNDRATFFWREDNRVAIARAEELVNELIGLKLGADALLPILTGCVTRSTTVTTGVRYGDLLAISTDRGRVFLRQAPAGWRARYGEVEGLKVDYRWQAGPWPREIVIGAQQGTPSEVRLVVRIDDGAIVDAPLGPQTFSLSVPASATPMTLAELRALLRDR